MKVQRKTKEKPKKIPRGATGELKSHGRAKEPKKAYTKTATDIVKDGKILETIREKAEEKYQLEPNLINKIIKKKKKWEKKKTRVKSIPQRKTNDV